MRSLWEAAASATALSTAAQVSGGRPSPAPRLHVPAHACTCLHVPARACTCLHVPARACACLRMPARACTCLHVPARACTCLSRRRPPSLLRSHPLCHALTRTGLPFSRRSGLHCATGRHPVP
eukprot:1427323-Prymnesium_polylepis.1